MADTAVRKCESCESMNVSCTLYKDIRVSSGRTGDRWLCPFCAHTLFGALLIRMSGNGGFHMDPILVRGIIQSLHIAVKMIRGEL